MAALLNKTLEIETSRRNLLKYGSLAGISSLAGINLLNTSALQNINILESSAALNLNNINSALNNVPVEYINHIDYTTKPYNLFMVTENINLVNKLTANKRIENIYLYSKSINNGLTSKITAEKSLSSLLLSLGTIIPFDYDITYIDMKAWKLRDAFLYISDTYAEIQNSKNAKLNEEKLLSSLNILGTYNKNIYAPNISQWQKGELKTFNLNILPVGNLISL